MNKKLLSLLLALAMIFALAACTSSAAGSAAPAASAASAVTESAAPAETSASEKPVELIVFAAASMTETLNQIAQLYKEVAPNVTLTFSFDSSGILKSQIEEGADCDIFISAAQKQMNELDIAAAADTNPDGLDFVNSDTRFNLVSNRVVLIVPEGNPAGVTAFEDVATEVVSLIALGNFDVPVGQYSEQIFTYLGVWEQLGSDQKITFGTNVKEVLAQVAEGAVDCGVVYSTDAATAAGVEVVASAPAGSHKDITYPAAILKGSNQAEAAQAFFNYLTTSACSAVFESVGFIIPG